jgi:polyferredoxin
MSHQTDYEALFSKLTLPEPPAGLAKTILARIEKRERRMLAIKASAQGVFFAASVWVIQIGYTNLVDGFQRSGFLTFTSLLFSDFSLVTSNLSDYLFSIIESFPIFSAAILLGGVALAIWSMGMLISDAMLANGHRFSLLKQ